MSNLLKALSELFQLHINEVYKRSVFKKAIQELYDSVEHVCIRLRKLESTCNFKVSWKNWLKTDVLWVCVKKDTKKKITSYHKLILKRNK